MLTFQEEGHKYFWGGNQIPSVTQILKMAGLSNGVVDEVAAMRGKMVHSACEFYDEGDLDEAQLDPLIVPYLEGWKQFRKDTGLKMELIEKKLYSYLGFAGTIDRFSRGMLIDIKSGGVDWVTGLQLAGYEELIMCNFEEFKNYRIKKFTVQLTDEGKYKMTEYKDRYDNLVFKCALAVVTARLNHGGKIE